MIKSVIFDLDGTISHTNPLIFDSFNYISKKYLNKEFSFTELISYFGPTEEVLIKQLFNNSKYDTVINDYYRFYENNHKNYVTLHTGIIDLLNLLKSKNKSLSIFTGKGEKTTLITLNELGIKKYFELIIHGDNVTNSKPSSEGIKKIIHNFQLKNDEVIMVGDSVHDILSAREAGILIASALWDSYNKEEVISLNPELSFLTVDDLKNWLIKYI